MIFRDEANRVNEAVQPHEHRLLHIHVLERWRGMRNLYCTVSRSPKAYWNQNAASVGPISHNKVGRRNAVILSTSKFVKSIM